jgi:hypothetical protein
MQPTYYPWAGYLNLIAHCDLFVWLDDAQYERGSWQNRNRVLVGGKPHWLTVPVERDHLGAGIDRVRVDDKLPWRRKHRALVTQTYGRHPGADTLPTLLAPIDDPALTTLADLNIALVEALCDRFGIDTPRRRASALALPGVRTDRLVAFCAALGADEYLTTPGALDYLLADGFASRGAARLLVHRYTPAPYAQRGVVSGFESHLSIIDVLAHLGDAATAAYVLAAPDVDAVP